MEPGGRIPILLIVCACVQSCAWRSQNNCGRWCSPSLMWVPESTLRSLGLVVGALAGWAILPALQSSLSLSVLHHDCQSMTAKLISGWRRRLETSQRHPVRASALLWCHLQLHNNGSYLPSGNSSGLQHLHSFRVSRDAGVDTEPSSQLVRYLFSSIPIRYTAHSTVRQ